MLHLFTYFNVYVMLGDEGINKFYPFIHWKSISFEKQKDVSTNWRKKLKLSTETSFLKKKIIIAFYSYICAPNLDIVSS